MRSAPALPSQPSPVLCSSALRSWKRDWAWREPPACHPGTGRNASASLDLRIRIREFRCVGLYLEHSF